MTVTSLTFFTLFMFFIFSKDIELSQKECIMLTFTHWNETSAVNENSFKVKLARQYEIFKSTFMNWINNQKTASVCNLHFQRLSFKEEKAIYVWILRFQTWDWFSCVKQVHLIVIKLLIKKRNNKSVEINWLQKFLKHHL